ncbi:MAG: hypothetical protein ACLU90_07685 [Lachnospira sp.]
MLESRPNEEMTDEQLDSLSPWNELLICIFE